MQMKLRGIVFLRHFVFASILFHIKHEEPTHALLVHLRAWMPHTTKPGLERGGMVAVAKGGAKGLWGACSSPTQGPPKWRVGGRILSEGHHEALRD